MITFDLVDIQGMRRFSIRDLNRRLTTLFDDLEAEGPALITRNGRPLAVLSPITDPALRRKKALEPMPQDEFSRLMGVAANTAKPPQEEPLPDVELTEVERTILAEIVWFGGRAWLINDDDESRLTVHMMGATLGRLELERLITRQGSGQVPTRLGARYAVERLGREFIEKAGRACFYGFPPERLGYRPRGEENGVA